MVSRWSVRRTRLRVPNSLRRCSRYMPTAPKEIVRRFLSPSQSSDGICGLFHWGGHRIYCYENRTDALGDLFGCCDRWSPPESLLKELHCNHACFSVPKIGNRGGTSCSSWHLSGHKPWASAEVSFVRSFEQRQTSANADAARSRILAPENDGPETRHRAMGYRAHGLPRIVCR